MPNNPLVNLFCTSSPFPPSNWPLVKKKQLSYAAYPEANFWAEALAFLVAGGIKDDLNNLFPKLKKSVRQNGKTHKFHCSKQNVVRKSCCYT